MPTILTDTGLTFPNGSTQNTAPSGSAAGATPGHNYIKFPSGLIINFGYQKTTSSTMTITFAQPFSTAAYSIQASVNAADNVDTGGFGDVVGVRSGTLTTTGVQLSTVSNASDYVSYFAIGK